MIYSTLAANIFSKLGSNSSLLPMIVKDTAHSAGMTSASYVTGKEVEGKDRFIDEIGAEAIWVGGIPFYKKAIDLTLYKVAKYNSKVDIRLLKDKNVLEVAKKYAPTQEIKESIIKAATNQKTFKGLFMTKFIASTAMTLGSYWGLTVFRHNHTEKTIIKQLKHEEAQRKAKEEYFKGKNSPTFKAFAQQKSKTQNPSFGMNLSGLKDFMFNPVKNMMIVDGGITTERLGESRNPQDFMGYVVKEGAFWGFMYFAGAKIQKHFEKRSEEKHGKSIDMDIKALQDKELHQAFKKDKVTQSIEEIKKITKPEDLYEFLCTKDDNLVVKMAKTSGIVSVHGDTNKVDTQHFIDLGAINGTEKDPGLVQKLEKLYNNHKNSGETVEKFFEKTISLKRGSIIKNIGTCMGVLGVVVPGIMLAIRFSHKDNQEFAVKKELHEKLKKQNYFA